MTTKPSLNVKRNIANVFGSFGYMFCLLQWFWAVLLYFSLVQSAISFTLSTNGVQPEPVAHPTVVMPSQLETGLVVVVTVIVVVMVLYALIKVPRGVARTGSRIVHQASDSITPIVIKAQHKKDTKKNRMALTPKLMIIVKVILIFIPVMLGTLAWLIEKLPIDYTIAVVISIGLAGLSMVSFLFQYMVSKWLRVKSSDLW